MKKSLPMILALSMVLSLTGCAGGGTQQASSEADTAVESSAAESSVVESTAAETESAAAESTVAEESTAAEETSAAEGTETAAAQSGEVLSHEEYMAAELDSLVTVEAYVQAKQSWWEDKATVYAPS